MSSCCSCQHSEWSNRREPVLALQSISAHDEARALANSSLIERIEELERQIDADRSKEAEFGSRWKNRLIFETSDGDFQARFGGRIEQDWLWITGDDELEAAVGTLEDGVFFRRARIQGNGTIYGVIDYFAEFEFAPVENIVFQDVWIQFNQLGSIGKLRAGHLKVPFFGQLNQCSPSDILRTLCGA